MRLPVFTISAFALLVCLSFSSTLQAEGPNPEKEKELIALLRSEAPAAEKAKALGSEAAAQVKEKAVELGNSVKDAAGRAKESAEDLLKKVPKP